MEIIINTESGILTEMLKRSSGEVSVNFNIVVINDKILEIQFLEEETRELIFSIPFNEVKDGYIDKNSAHILSNILKEV